MKTGFHDPIQSKDKERKIRSPWNFEAPSYDDRNSICCGTDHGVGYRTPVGREGNAKTHAPSLPMGRINVKGFSKDDSSLEVK